MIQYIGVVCKPTRRLKAFVLLSQHQRFRATKSPHCIRYSKSMWAVYHVKIELLL